VGAADIRRPFALFHGGAYRVYGPDGSMINDNNHLATALPSPGGEANADPSGAVAVTGCVTGDTA
jgi:hypothetical protein